MRYRACRCVRAPSSRILPMWVKEAWRMTYEFREGMSRWARREEKGHAKEEGREEGKEEEAEGGMKPNATACLAKLTDR